MRKPLLVTMVFVFSLLSGGTAVAEQSAWNGFKQDSKKVWSEVKKGSKKGWQATKKDSKAAAKEISKGSKGMWQSLKDTFK